MIAMVDHGLLEPISSSQLSLEWYLSLEVPSRAMYPKLSFQNFYRLSNVEVKKQDSNDFKMRLFKNLISY